MLTLKGRRTVKEMPPQSGLTILDHALKSEVDWGFSCSRGTCARCRCYIVEGAGLLNQPTDAELDRLEPEEIEQGYRLGCQASVRAAGTITVHYKPYF